MIKYRLINNPLFIFILSLLALGTSLYLYIDSYLSVNHAFRRFVEKRNMNPDAFLETQTWVMILILSLLVALIVLGVVLIFTYYQKMIQLYRMQQNFINGFTHELKTPLASLRLFLDTFEKHDLSREQQRKYIAYMMRDTKRLSDNVSQILNLSRIEEKKYKATWREAPLWDVLKSWLKSVSYLNDEIDFILRETSEKWVLTKIRYDENLLPLVFMNLVNNAMIYNHSKRPRLEIELFQNGKMVSLSFCDNGPGIDFREGKNIFKKFYQIKASGKGSGIGLYLVQVVMKFHRGQVRLKKEEFPRKGERGATFFLEFPIAGSH